MTYHNPEADCIVENFSQLRSLQPSDCESVKVLGYKNQFDGRGGFFIRISNNPSNVDNDGTLVVSISNPAYCWRKWL